MAGIPVGVTEPNYQQWSDVPPAEQNYISSLLDSWLSLVGYTVQVPQWAIMAMAQEGVNSLHAVGQFMWRHIYDGSNDPGAYFVAPQQIYNSPWAAFGLNADQFHVAQTQYGSLMQQLTGTLGDWGHFWDRMKDQGGQMNMAWLRENVTHDANMIKSYGWLKYGMDYNQFTQQKQQMKGMFGRELSNEEGIGQLEYLHAAHSADHAVHARLTLSQEEKKKADVGVSDNVVR